MIFKQFEQSDIVAGRTQPVSTGLWSDGTSSWAEFFTSSAQTQLSSSAFEPLNGLYYTNVYDANPSQSNADIYFSVTYGHYAGSGSSNFDTSSANGSLIYPTQAIYNQYRNLILTPADTKFTFISSSAGGLVETSSNDIHVVAFRSAKYKDRLDPGQFQITLSGSLGRMTLIDDSRYNPQTTLDTGGKRYNLIRGTIDSGITSTGYEALGSMYPDLGLIVLNPDKIGALIGTVNGKNISYNASNWGGGFARMQNVLFESIQLGARTTPMLARVTEYVAARHFFVRVKNQEYNYSNNPTFVITQADQPTNPQDIGKLRFTDFYTDPKVYITTVGLYNESNDLVAVAKLSQPLLKDFTNECLIKIKIDI
jgi:hypothetical protein